MRQKDYTWRLFFFLLLVWLISICLSFLPQEIGGLTIKKVDPLSQLNPSEGDLAPIDSLHDADNTIAIGPNDDQLSTAAPTPVYSLDTTQESKEDAHRDSLYLQILAASKDSTDSELLLQDFSQGHRGVAHTMQAIKDKEQVHIAFAGDSFIEGDILTYDLRAILQSHFGGSGVGFMPITSHVAGFRKGIKHTFYGWKTVDAHKGKSHYLSGYWYQIKKAGAYVSYSLEEKKRDIDATIYYSSKKPIPIDISTGDTVIHHILKGASDLSNKKASLPDSIENNEEKAHSLEESEIATTTAIGSEKSYQQIQTFTFPIVDGKVKITFPEESEGIFYGIALDQHQKSAICIDNFSLRGSSGTQLAHIDLGVSRSMNMARKPHLIVLQYGLNVVAADRHNYSSYIHQMSKVIDHLRDCFPESDILLLGPSDRGARSANGMQSMPSILSMRKALLDLAKQKGIVFWDTYKAMQKDGGISAYVTRGWAAKDYTHLSFRGGKQLANLLGNSFIAEYELYQQMGL